MGTFDPKAQDWNIWKSERRESHKKEANFALVSIASVVIIWGNTWKYPDLFD